MKVEHYSFWSAGKYMWRWRIVDKDGRLVARGERMHDSMDESKYDVREVLEFLEAVSVEEARSALRGTL